MTLDELKAKGFTFEAAKIGEDLICVRHAQPFRHFNPKFVKLSEGRAHAQQAAADPEGGFFMFTTPMAMPKAPLDDFAFAFIMESSIIELDTAAEAVAVAALAAQEARDRLMCLVKDSTLY